jgi:hypothetical protein
MWVLGFDSRRELGIFLFTTVSRTALGSTQPPIQWVAGTLSLGVKRPGREAGHSPPPSAEVKNAWSYISTPQYVFMAWCLVKYRDNLTYSIHILLVCRQVSDDATKCYRGMKCPYPQQTLKLLCSHGNGRNVLCTRSNEIVTIRTICHMLAPIATSTLC